MRVRAAVLVGLGAIGGSVLTATFLMNDAACPLRLPRTPVTTKYVRLKTPASPRSRSRTSRPNRRRRSARTKIPTSICDPLQPELGKRWWSWLTFIWNPNGRGDAALTLYDKELVILRTNWLCHDDWVWGQHVPIAKREGRTDADIERIPKGPAASGWNEKIARC